MTRPIEVGIIGAGLAGLRCADILLQNGCKVTIFEARDRIGGRVAQSDHLGHLVDLGANWIHGTTNNPIAELAKQTGTITTGWDEDEALIDSEGKTIDPDEAEEYSSILWDDGLIAEAFRYSRANQDSIDANRSLYDFFTEKAESFFLDKAPEVAKRKRETLLQVACSWGAYVGNSVRTQSLRCFWLEEVIEGENLFVAETYKKILQTVAKAALEKADLRLSTKVLYVGPREAASKATMRTSDGEMTFDEVVVTVPLGCLQRDLDSFLPQLPPRLTQAIKNLGYGTLDKVYITFPTAFWDVAVGNVKASMNGIDPAATTPNVKATTTPLHQPHANGTKPHYAGFTHWLSPLHADSDSPAQGDQECMNLAALPEGCAHPTLLFYIYGACSVHIAQIVANTRTGDERDARLLRFFEPYYSSLPNYDASRAQCKPKAVLATAWAADELAGYGSYSNFQVGLEDGAKDIEIMRHGMPEQGIWFAGEHTAPFESSGTTTGAYVSGEMVAKRIVETHRKGR